MVSRDPGLSHKLPAAPQELLRVLEAPVGSTITNHLSMNILSHRCYLPAPCPCALGAGWVLLPCPGSIPLPHVAPPAPSPSPGSHPPSLSLLLRRWGPGGGTTPTPGNMWDPDASSRPLFPGCHSHVPPSIPAAPRPVPLETHPGAEAWGILSSCSPFNPPLSRDRAGLVPSAGSPARRGGCWRGEGTPGPTVVPPRPAGQHPLLTCPTAAPLRGTRWCGRGAHGGWWGGVAGPTQGVGGH